MSDTIEILLVDGDDETVAQAVDAMLDEAAAVLGHPFEGKKVQLSARDAEGNLVGGLIGAHLQRWFFVKLLAVSPEARGGGIGANLLARAEHMAREEGLVGIYLDTFEFQAPRFYQRQGYREIGRLPKLGNAQQRIWFAKEFNNSGSTT
ncbi:GCN5 family acetyltransferase [Rhizobium sp. Root274]|uniref:GNAT family N-acetyltransferase n=1 Tax=unclassified Rhizobium TaxID=2613769 RepID=UPI0007146F9F|nr:MULTISPECIES: GNAT family N-acetyltransferase [unclassified Rhizobium]KQW27519.1 GCN5 family acetyltransferase [Rhizobium sp. Root1240]KRD27756.1 GCN5 family acetyltransferase [Rhizobium sp. Root274]